MTTSAEATPAKEPAGTGQDSANLQDLLNEYESDAGTPAPEAAPAATAPDPAALAKLAQDVEEIRTARAAEETRRAVDGIVTSMREAHDELRDLDPKVVTALLHQAATEDRRIAAAFMDRHKAPDRWGQVVKQLGKQFAETFAPLHARQTTEDRRGAAAGARGISHNPPAAQAMPFDPAQVSAMSHDEYSRWKQSFLAGKP